MKPSASESTNEIPLERISLYIETIKPKFTDDNMRSPHRKQQSKKNTVRFELSPTLRKNNRAYSTARILEIGANSDQVLDRAEFLESEFSRNAYLKSYQSNDYFPFEISTEKQKGRSMGETEIERLLDESFEKMPSLEKTTMQNILGTMTSMEEKVEKLDRSREAQKAYKDSRSPSIVNESEILSNRSRRWHRHPAKRDNIREDDTSITQDKIQEFIMQNHPLRRKSCNCTDCGQSKKLSKASALFLNQDLELLKKLYTKSHQKKSSLSPPPGGILSVLSHNFTMNMGLPATSEKPIKDKITKRMAKLFDINRIESRFELKKLKQLQSSKNLTRRSSGYSPKSGNNSPSHNKGSTQPLSPILLKGTSVLSKHSSYNLGSPNHHGESPLSDNRPKALNAGVDGSGDKRPIDMNTHTVNRTMFDAWRKSKEVGEHAVNTTSDFRNPGAGDSAKNPLLVEEFGVHETIEEKDNEYNQTPHGSMDGFRKHNSSDYYLPSKFSQPPNKEQLTNGDPPEQISQNTNNEVISSIEKTDSVPNKTGNGVGSLKKRSSRKKVTGEKPQKIKRFETLRPSCLSDKPTEAAIQSERLLEREIQQVIARTGKHIGWMSPANAKKNSVLVKRYQTPQHSRLPAIQ